MYISAILRQGQKTLVWYERNITSDTLKGLIDNSSRIKPQNLNKGKLHLNKSGSKILPNNFLGKISKVLNRQSGRDNPNVVPGEGVFNQTFSAKMYTACNTTLKNIRSDNINVLIFAHLNANSIRKKSEFLPEQAKGEIEIF